MLVINPIVNFFLSIISIPLRILFSSIDSIIFLSFVYIYLNFSYCYLVNVMGFDFFTWHQPAE